MKSTRTTFSIIVPVFNEAALIGPFLQHLRDRAPAAEIIVADGGSTDGTADLSAGLCDQLVVSECNRAMQMNAGARAAHGDMLWFVHVDAEVPWGCLDEIRRIMNDPGVTGGYFRIRLPRNAVYRLTDSFAHYAGILLRMRCGDHGIFCRRTVFADVGGFPEVPLMEDVEFFRRLHRCGRVMYSENGSWRARGAMKPLDGPSNSGLWIDRSALCLRRPTEKTRVDLQTYVLQAISTDFSE